MTYPALWASDVLQHSVMKAFRAIYLAGLVFACAPIGGRTIAGEPGSVGPETGSASGLTYEVALINKSMTGDWKDERKFKTHVKEHFAVSKVLKFRLRGDPLQDWLEKEEPCIAKVICLVDGWVDPGMTRVDVRGFREGEPLKLTVEVEDGDWKAALARVKQYVEGAVTR